MDFEQKKKEIESKYQELEKTKQALISQAKEIEIEQLMLKGEFRLLKEITTPKKVAEEKK